MDLNNRFFIFRNNLRLNQAQLAESLGVGQTSISKYEKGESVPEQTLIILELKYNLNREWFKTGKGKMLRSNEYQKADFNQIIEEPISNLYMDTDEINDLKTLVKDLMATVRDQAGTLKGYANAEEINAKARLNLTETIMSQERVIENLSGAGMSSKNAVGDASK